MGAYALGPVSLGPRLVLGAPTCVVRGHLQGGDTGQKQLQVKDPLGAHDLLCMSPINVYPGVKAPKGYWL